MQVLTDLIVAIDLRNLKMNIKPRLHYNVLGTARLIFWYECRCFSARHEANSHSVNGADSAPVPRFLGAIHTSELDRSEIDLSPKRSECERSNVN